MLYTIFIKPNGKEVMMTHQPRLFFSHINICQISINNCQPPKKFGKRNAASEKLKNHKSSHLLTGFSGGFGVTTNG